MILAIDQGTTGTTCLVFDANGARYEPTMSGDDREELLAGWHRAVSRSRGWAASE